MMDLDSEESFRVMSFQCTWMTGKPQENLSLYASRALRYTELFGRFFFFYLTIISNQKIYLL
jgi:hypothetical protein